MKRGPLSSPQALCNPSTPIASPTSSLSEDRLSKCKHITSPNDRSWGTPFAILINNGLIINVHGPQYDGTIGCRSAYLIPIVVSPYFRHQQGFTLVAEIQPAHHQQWLCMMPSATLLPIGKYLAALIYCRLFTAAVSAQVKPHVPHVRQVSA